MALLGLDLGTSRCKAGLVLEDGRVIRVATQELRANQASDGIAYYDPHTVWQASEAVIRQVMNGGDHFVQAIGIASMAETGLLIDRRDRSIRSPLIPWFDLGAQPQAERLAEATDPFERFCRSGGRIPTFKSSLAKVLWLNERQPIDRENWVWLCTADWIGLCLTGQLGTELSLATRTGAFRIDIGEWDEEWLGRFGLSSSLFPDARPAGTPLGELLPEPAGRLGLKAGIPVAICGHDHLAAAFAAGIIQPGQAFDSMGTAEALVGARERIPLGQREYLSGLSYGCHVVSGMDYWIGGLSASGGSLEWLRSIIGEPAIDYDGISRLAGQIKDRPGGILFFPYLTGSGSPHSDSRVRGAFIGLTYTHNRADLLQSVLEGTAFEVEYIRQTAELASGKLSPVIHSAGGGTKLPIWMQIKADISGQTYKALDMPEATLLGAALLAGAGSGVYSSQTEALTALETIPVKTYEPNPQRHVAYTQIFRQGYLAFQDPLRRFFEQSPFYKF